MSMRYVVCVFIFIFLYIALWLFCYVVVVVVGFSFFALFCLAAIHFMDCGVVLFCFSYYYWFPPFFPSGSSFWLLLLVSYIFCDGPRRNNNYYLLFSVLHIAIQGKRFNGTLCKFCMISFVFRSFLKKKRLSFIYICCFFFCRSLLLLSFPSCFVFQPSFCCSVPPPPPCYPSPKTLLTTFLIHVGVLDDNDNKQQQFV